MTIYYPITVDLYNKFPLPIMDAQQNNIGRGAIITLTAAGEVVVPEGEIINIYAKLSGGYIAYASCELVGNQIRVKYDAQMLAEPGILDMEIQMIDSSGNTITTTIYQLRVNKSNIDYRTINRSNEFAALVDALAAVEKLKETGLIGKPGKAATVRIGTVTTGAPGSRASVENVGTETDAVWNITIPTGETGPKGNPGPISEAIDPDGATEEDIGKAADAYYTGLVLRELTGKMSDAINLIASDYIAITLNTDVAFDTDFQCFEKNRKVYLFTTIILKTAVSGSRTLGTIAEKYRPVAGYVVCSARSRQIPYTEQGTVWLHAGGSAVLYGTFSAGSKVYIQTEYTI